MSMVANNEIAHYGDQDIPNPYKQTFHVKFPIHVGFISSSIQNDEKYWEDYMKKEN